MAYEVQDLLEGIQKGSKEFSSHPIRIEHPEEVPHPEYLTTSSIAFTLAEIGFQNHENPFTVKCEENTRRVWNGSLVSWLVRTSRSTTKNPFKKSLLKNRQRDSKERPGNIDITLLKPDGFPFAIIETKGMLSFKQDGELYVASVSEVKKDLVRNAEYILNTGRRQGVQYSAFTFYAKDPSSVLQADARGFIQKMERYFHKFVGNLKLHPSVKVHVHIGTFDSHLYATREDAMELDQHGAPAQDMQPAWHTIFGVISLYLVGGNISDAKLIDMPT